MRGAGQGIYSVCLYDKQQQQETFSGHDRFCQSPSFLKTAVKPECVDQHEIVGVQVEVEHRGAENVVVQLG